MSTLPLIWNYQAAAPLCRVRERLVTHAQFLAAAQRLAQRLPAAGYAINHCQGRYAFMLAFAAVLLRGQTNLLPSSQAPGALEDLRACYPGAYVVSDQPARDGCGVPAVSVDLEPAGAWRGAVPQIPAGHTAAVVFTSGSTGSSLRHAKLWRTLYGTAQQALQRFGGGVSPGIVATVPPQHMYGLEATVLMALCAGWVAQDGRPFYPADVREALALLAAPRVLVTTPVHIRALLDAGAALPALRLVISATAPLSPELAQRAEAAFGAPLHEIYGFTEAGSVASRRTLDGPAWTLYPGLSLRGTAVCGPHLPQPVPVPDALESIDPLRFRLLGRPQDMLKVAGKRALLSDLTLKLLDLPGVEDAVVFLPDGADRPAALVVGRPSESEILAWLSHRLDPVFLPRPLKKVPRLPRNEVGKLPRAALMQVLAV